ncbi:MAG TPA: hypothetical protein VI643_06890 [Planctomycetota bacterium]|nr:hypothetical protein [Planctomycetota bacterium]
MDEATTRHHLIPRSLRSNKWFKKKFSREEMLQTIPICEDCHGAIDTLDVKEIGRNFNTAEKLLEHPHIAKFVAWKRRNRSPG